MSIPLERTRNAAYRRDALWLAALVHRVSGVLLACFLPLHFLALALAIEGEARLDGFLRWTDTPAVKLAETVLIGLLAIHVLGGLRILAVEMHGWRPGQRGMVLAAVGLSAVIAAVFLLRIG